MVTRTISAGSVYGRSPECLAWVQTHTDNHQHIHTVCLDTDAHTLTLFRFLGRDGSLHHDPATGEAEEAAPEVVPLRSLPDVLDVLAAVERFEEHQRRYRQERLRERQEHARQEVAV